MIAMLATTVIPTTAAISISLAKCLSTPLITYMVDQPVKVVNLSGY
jgi:hypothetical protein